MNIRSDVLIVEISGKRPGGSDKRPTERMPLSFDKVIITNNSDGYETDWEIVEVPEEFRAWYIQAAKTSDNAWYAPMNRSYAIKYAKEHGYKYLVQLDDNINQLRIAYKTGSKYKQINKIQRAFRYTETSKDYKELANDMIEALSATLDHTNCGMCGMSMCGASRPNRQYICEAYVYSFFMLKLSAVPELFQGDFEDDIEYRLKLAQMGIPAAQLQFFQYGKTSQGKNKDLTGCRKEYAEAGIKRGEHMRLLYGDVYSAGMQHRGHSIGAKAEPDTVYFKHKVKPFKVGIQIRQKEELDRIIYAILQKYYRGR